MEKREMKNYARILYRIRERREEIELIKQLIGRLTENDPMSPFDMSKPKPTKGLLVELTNHLHSNLENLEELTNKYELPAELALVEREALGNTN